MNNIAIVGFNNALAKNILELMSLRGYTSNYVKVFSTNVQKNTKVSFGEDEISVANVEELNPADFSAIIFTENDKTASIYGNKFAKSKVRIINATKAFEGDENIPMVVGGINETQLDKANKNIINVPHPFVVEFLSAIVGLAQKYTIKRINLSTYTSVDYENQDGMSELYNQTRKILMNDTASTSGLFHKTIAFNVIPQVSSFIGEETEVEWLYNSQIKQVLGFNTKVHANCAVVPVFVGQGVFANIEVEEEIDADEVREDIKKAKGVLVVDRQEDGGYITINDAQGESSVFISRIRQDISVENGVSLWICGDAYKIAAQNILALLKQFLKKEI